MSKIDVFSFEDFLNRDTIKESNSEESNIVPIVDTKPVETVDVEEVMSVDIEEFVIAKEEQNIVVESIEDNYYKLYKDINEEFSCDIAIEGTSADNTSVRIIVESKDWSLMFPGSIRNGKCVVPIKKLGILNEGEIGTIKIEVVAEGNLFIPWEDQFKVKMSKKVTVSLNETNIPKSPFEKNGIKVNIKK